MDSYDQDDGRGGVTTRTRVARSRRGDVRGLAGANSDATCTREQYYRAVRDHERGLTRERFMAMRDALALTRS